MHRGTAGDGRDGQLEVGEIEKRLEGEKDSRKDMGLRGLGWA